MNDKTKYALLILLRWFLAVVFIYAALGKIADPAAFAQQIDHYRLLPWPAVAAAAVVLPWLELLCGLLLIGGRWIQGASLWLMTLNGVFIIAIASAMVRGLDIDCGCFSLQGHASRVSLQRIVEDVLFLLIAALTFKQAHSARTE
ncbi:MAG TPA: MauE/DoxX family redox-associated membrane protein [bacterium]|nr:MauE/DoxX family redox-associated membrane protein [bacterium]HPN34154.1 MauE/DoxX family redox-associated membrane protein [bacterium]